METNISWERCPGETSKAYKVFCEYRDMGSERSGVKVGQMLNVNKSYIDKLSSKYNWVNRAREFDDYIEARVRARNENEIIEMRIRHAKQARDLQDTLALPLEVLNRKIEKDPNLNELDKLKLNELLGLVTQSAKCLKQLTEIEREARGVPSSTYRTEVTVDGNARIDILKELVDNMSDEQKEGVLNAPEDD